MPSTLSLLSINHLGLYYPYRNGTNPMFNSFSSNILKLKDEDIVGVIHFLQSCSGWLIGDFQTVVTIPSHDPLKKETGIKTFARFFAQQNNLVNGTECLKRSQKIDKLSHGGNRNVDVHLSSMFVEQINIIEGKKVLLLDDVTTTGNSLLASRQLLFQAGAMSVCMCALAKTSND